EPWLAIDPKPLAGDPGFDLLPALDNRWDEVVASGDVRRAVLRRFDLLVEVLELDPARAAGWTLGRVLQNALWSVQAGEDRLGDVRLAVAEAVSHRQEAGYFRPGSTLPRAAPPAITRALAIITGLSR